MNPRRILGGVRAPDESAAQERAWTVVRSAYAERAPAVRRHSRRRLAVVPALAAVIGGLILSPAGATVSRWIGHALGVPHAAPALFRLPAPGSVLVSGAGGTWTVSADGSARRLGPWRQASWSPNGLFVAVTGSDELAAVDPHGTVRWKLARPAVSDARWYPPTGFRISYLSGHDLRVVAGDGTGDHVLATGVAATAPTWRPDHPYQLAYLTQAGRLVVRDADSGRTLWSAVPPARPRALAWSADGRHLLVVAASAARVYSAGGRLTTTISTPTTPIRDASLSPDGRTLALIRGGGSDDVALASLASGRPQLQRMLSGVGLRQLAWSPDGRWLLVSWPAADQWVFIRVAGKPRIAAVSRIARQFSPGSAVRGFPTLEGWCCTAQGAAG
jgi:hypothetical protein